MVAADPGIRAGGGTSVSQLAVASQCWGMSGTMRGPSRAVDVRRGHPRFDFVGPRFGSLGPPSRALRPVRVIL